MFTKRNPITSTGRWTFLYESGIHLIIATDLFSVPRFKEFTRGKRYPGSNAAVKEFRRFFQIVWNNEQV